MIYFISPLTTFLPTVQRLLLVCKHDGGFLFQTEIANFRLHIYNISIFGGAASVIFVIFEWSLVLCLVCSYLSIVQAVSSVLLSSPLSFVSGQARSSLEDDKFYGRPRSDKCRDIVSYGIMETKIILYSPTSPTN